MSNLLSRDIRQCTAAGMRFRRVKQENHNPFTGTEISHRAGAKRLAERERIYDSFTTCRLLPARRPAMLVGDEHRASERRRHAAMRSSIGRSEEHTSEL